MLRKLLLFVPFCTVLAPFPREAAGQSLEQQVVALVNEQRAANGNLPPLKAHAQLDAAAEGHSEAMGVRNFFMHCDPDTLTNPGQRISAQGYAWRTWAENIAAGRADAAGVMAQWMNSSGHRANVLSGSVNEIGVGYHNDASDANTVRGTTSGCTVTSTGGGPYRHYWTQVFGRRDNHYPVVIAREAYSTPTCDVALYVYGTGFATEMRFSNDGTTWSPWMTYSANTSWGLRGNAGQVATVFAEVRNGGTVRSAQDTIVLGATCGVASGEAPMFSNGFE